MTLILHPQTCINFINNYISTQNIYKQTCITTSSSSCLIAFNEPSGFNFSRGLKYACVVTRPTGWSPTFACLMSLWKITAPPPVPVLIVRTCPVWATVVAGVCVDGVWEAAVG
jgi:hypothetical protein